MSSGFYPHEVYSRCLLGAYGYPLWTPQLNAELREEYQLDGLKIGDVGVISPIDGSFDVLFNITLQRPEQPYPELLREDFTPIILDRGRDLTTQLDAVSVHGVIPSASVELKSKEIATDDQTPAKADYEFSLSKENGAVLILPEGAQSCDLRNEKRFLDETIRRAVDWYKCATEEAGRLIDDNSLYLITGSHKTCSWSLGAAERREFNPQDRRLLRFRVGRILQNGITAGAYHWVAGHGFTGRVGPRYPYGVLNPSPGRVSHGFNQTVFVRGFRIMVNKILFLETVAVKTRQGTFYRFGSNLVDFLSGSRSEDTPSSSTAGATEPVVDQDFSVNRAPLHTDAHITINRVPNLSQTFHPGDLINQYMLKASRAVVAITHDDLWIEMLRTGLLQLTDFSREDHLQEVLSKNYQIIMEGDAVYLQKDLRVSPPTAPAKAYNYNPDPLTVPNPALPSKSTFITTQFLPLPDLTPYLLGVKDQYAAGGSFGDVYRCLYNDGSGLMEVAVKAFRLNFTMEGDSGSKSIRMLRRELEIWRRLRHRNVVPFLGIAHSFGMEGSTSLVSMWMPNESLHKFLAMHDNNLGVRHRLQFLMDIASGLAYLHSFPIVHGDLHCNNVLLDADYTARLADFGYASLVGNIPEALIYLQRSTARPGALRWVAPEQITAEEVLSGKQPWSEVREDAAVVLCLAQGHKPRRPQSRAMDDSHWNFIQTCWLPIEKRPTAEGIISEIQHLMEGCPPSEPLFDAVKEWSNQTDVVSEKDRRQELAMLPEATNLNSDLGESTSHIAGKKRVYEEL